MPTVSPPPVPTERPELKTNILLVDDTPANLLALEAILDGLGYHLVRAVSGEEALRLAESWDFAVVLLDVRMQGLDGFETAKRLRGQERSRHTPIIFLTAHDDDQLFAEQAYALGAVDYLVKPLVPIVLRAKVAGLVELFEQKEQARRQADQFRLLVQATVDYAIFLLDPDGKVASWNAGAERIKGYRAEEIIGQHFSRFYPQEAIDRGWPDEELRRATAAGRFEDEGWRLRKDGSPFWANVVITALKDETGHLRGFSKLTRDLTERKRKEEELRQLQRDLEKRVEERTADLAASNKALQAEVVERERAEGLLREADRRKDDWLAMLAHELRGPLSPVSNAVQILVLKGQADAEAEQARDVIARQTRHLARIVDDLLEVTRLLKGQVRLHSERLDLAGLVRTATEDYRPAMRAAGMTLSLEVPETPVWVTGDATRLSQIVGNLLDNAVKFRDGGDRIEVCVRSEPEHRQAVLIVRDRGIGIEAALLPILFEVFAQADQSLHRTKGGLGLGLSLVKGLVGLHEGEVRAASAGLGQGAEFTVLLPLQQEPTALKEQPASRAPAAQRLRILVVEDSKDAARSLQLLLTLMGHEVRVAYTGPDGVAVATAWCPEVIISDIGLPGLDGYGVASEVRKNPVTARTRLIAVTGFGREEDRQRALASGFDCHLTKPADPAELMRVLAGGT